MKSPNGFVLRWLKNVNFGAIWSCTIFLLYRTMLLYKKGTLEPDSTDSPATLAESIVKSCYSLDQINLKTSQPGGHVAILARRSPRASALVARVLRQSAHNPILLMADAAIFESLRIKMPSDDLPSLRFLDILHPYTVDELTETLESFRVEQLHILLDEFDFSPLDFSTDIGDLLQGLIKTFEVLSKHTDIPIYLHAPRERFVPSFRTELAYQIGNTPDHLVVQHNASDHRVLLDGVQHPTREGRIPRNHKINSCDPLYDYDFYHDVFMKSVGIYTKTYMNLYKFRVLNVVH